MGTPCDTERVWDTVLARGRRARDGDGLVRREGLRPAGDGDLDPEAWLDFCDDDELIDPSGLKVASNTDGLDRRV